MTDFISELALFCKDFNAKLPKLFPQTDAVENRVVAAMYYSLSNGGKRLRPYLVTQTAALFGIAPEKSFVTAAALECLHTYSLIHDDLPSMDNDDLRRGKPTCHKQFDEATAVLAGDGLLTYAFELISGSQNPLSEAIKCRLCFMLGNASGAFNGMIAGQMIDLITEHSSEIEDKEYTIRHIEEMKTGRLLRFACEAGAVIGNASPEQYQALSQYARKIGTAFQIVDDILDVEGSQELMGKTLGKDALQDKLTFVSLYGLQTAKNIARDLINDAKAQLAIFGQSAKNLQELADFILSRQN